jgi:hypothetical protein
MVTQGLDIPSPAVNSHPLVAVVELTRALFGTWPSLQLLSIRSGLLIDHDAGKSHRLACGHHIALSVLDNSDRQAALVAVWARVHSRDLPRLSARH